MLIAGSVGPRGSVAPAWTLVAAAPVVPAPAVPIVIPRRSPRPTRARFSGALRLGERCGFAGSTRSWADWVDRQSDECCRPGGGVIQDHIDRSSGAEASSEPDRDFRRAEPPPVWGHSGHHIFLIVKLGQILCGHSEQAGHRRPLLGSERALMCLSRVADRGVVRVGGVRHEKVVQCRYPNTVGAADADGR